MATQMDLAQQDEAAQLLREGARLLYTVAAGQFWQLDDVNAWFERYNATAAALELSDPYGAIGQRQNESDPLIEKAKDALTSLAAMAQSQANAFEDAVAAAQQGGGS